VAGLKSMPVMTVSGGYVIQNYFICPHNSGHKQSMKYKLPVKKYTPPDPHVFCGTGSFRRESNNPAGV
jgi:hypothetical protein